jgi:hypothetical protein
MKELGLILLMIMVLASLWICLGRSITISPHKIEEMQISYMLCRKAGSSLNCAYYVARGERFEEYVILVCGVKSTTIIGVKSDKRDLIIREHTSP